MAIDRPNIRFRVMAGFRQMTRSRPVPQRLHKPMAHIREKETPYHYTVQVVTRHKRTNDLIYRQIVIRDDHAPTLDELLTDAADIIMDSPTSKGEAFERAELLGARRWKI